MPLRILLAGLGSSGDVNPVIGLGCALKARGHRVTMVVNEIFAPQVEACGLGFISLGPREEAEAIMQDPRLWHPRKGFACIVEKGVAPNIARLYGILCEHWEPGTVVAATTLCPGARVAQEKLGIPLATIHLQPSVLRSHVDNGVLGPFNMGPGMPRPVKGFLFWLMDALYGDRLVRPGLNAFRATVGLAPVRGIFSAYIHSPQLVLGLFPDWYAPLQPDWPAHTRLTGFILHDRGGASQAHADADAFLHAGPAPVLVTPGSAAMDRTAFFEHSVAACAAAGVRAMLLTNHPGQLPRRLPAGIGAFAYVPFSRVMPRCAAIIYHGGIGTLAQAVRAGIPHLVVANAHDQPDNAHRVERLGIGLGMPQRRYSRTRAGKALRTVLTSESIRQRCRELAPRIDSARAEAAACSLIESLG